MKPKMQLAITSLAMVACFAWSPIQALAQAEQIEITAMITARTFLEPPVIEPVGPLTRMTVHVLWTATGSDPRLEGLQEIIGVWMIDPRDGSSVGRGKWTSVLTLGGQVDGTWCMDRSGTMHATGFVTGGELDGAILNLVSVAGHPLVGWVSYEGCILLPARK